MKIRQLAEHKLKKTIKLLAGAIALLVILIVPAGYYYIQHQNLSVTLQHTADIAADDISVYIFKNPDTWSYQEARLIGFLEKHINTNKRQVLLISQQHAVHIITGEIPEKTIRLVRHASVSDGVNIVAQVQIQASLQPVIINTVLTFIFSLFLGLMIYAILYFWPLKALKHAMLQLNEAHHKLEIEIHEKQALLQKAEKLSQKLHDMAMYDALTGLSNRVLFNDRLSHAIETAKRRKEEFALLFIDLDRFKTINDSFGHDIGDKVLQMVAQRLKNLVRKEDTVARLSGDEFTILMMKLNYAQDAPLLSEKILKSLSEPMLIDDHRLYVSSSIGISLYPKDDIEAENLLKFADAAMYKAKREGRNNFQFYTAEMPE